MEKITNFLIEQGVHRQTKPRKGAARSILPRVSGIARMFRDPFNYGLLVQANQNVDLRQIQPSFLPVTEEATFNQVQALGYSRTKDVAPKKRTAFYPLRGMVYCAVCENSNHMQVGKNKTGSGTYVLTYRCDNPACTGSQSRCVQSMCSIPFMNGWMD